MIERYSLPAMRDVWSEETRFKIWLEIEIVACEAMAELGKIPVADARVIRERARFSIPEIQAIEERTNHDVIAFLENVAASVGPEARWIHQGLTSSDVLDTCLGVQLSRSCEILRADLERLRGVIAERALEHKHSVAVGRTHGVHAEPVTYGLKLALMHGEFGRALERLEGASARVRVGKLSGAVGTHAHLDPRVERMVCERLGLAPAPVSNQIVQRDRHAEYVTVLALVGASVERWATEFRHLQRTEVLEVEEYFGEGQKGSSAMPHKRNPILGERLCGLARVLRGNAVAAMENVALWHERDISHSGAERVILPDSSILLDYMLVKLTDLVGRQLVYPERMRANLELTRGLVFSQNVLLELTRRGMERRAAYEAVQRAAMRTWKGPLSLSENLKVEPEVRATLGDEEIDRLCSPDNHLRHIDEIFARAGLG